MGKTNKGLGEVSSLPKNAPPSAQTQVKCKRHETLKGHHFPKALPRPKQPELITDIFEGWRELKVQPTESSYLGLVQGLAH